METSSFISVWSPAREVPAFRDSTGHSGPSEIAPDRRQPTLQFSRRHSDYVKAQGTIVLLHENMIQFDREGVALNTHTNATQMAEHRVGIWYLVVFLAFAKGLLTLLAKKVRLAKKARCEDVLKMVRLWDKGWTSRLVQRVQKTIFTTTPAVARDVEGAPEKTWVMSRLPTFRILLLALILNFISMRHIF